MPGLQRQPALNQPGGSPPLARDALLLVANLAKKAERPPDQQRSLGHTNLNSSPQRANGVFLTVSAESAESHHSLMQQSLRLPYFRTGLFLTS